MKISQYVFAFMRRTHGHFVVGSDFSGTDVHGHINTGGFQLMDNLFKPVAFC
jgi:hypothetical protein